MAEVGGLDQRSDPLSSNLRGSRLSVGTFGNWN